MSPPHTRTVVKNTYMDYQLQPHLVIHHHPRPPSHLPVPDICVDTDLQ